METMELSSPQPSTSSSVGSHSRRSLFQSPQQRHQALRDALDCTSSVEVNDAVKAVEVLTSAVHQADDAHRDIDDRIVNQDQILLDSQVMKASSHAIKGCMQSWTQGSSSYVASEFAQNLLAYINQLPDETGLLSPWELFSKEKAHLIKVCGSHHNFLHSMQVIRMKTETENSEEASRSLTQTKTRVTRQRDALAPAKQPEKIATIANDDNPVDKSVEKISHLIRKYNKRHAEPLNFFKLIIDPRDFGKTVENMLHVAFLLRDGKMTLKVGDEGDLFIEAVPRAHLEDDDDNQNHVRIPNVPALTMTKWRLMIDTLKITEPMINWE